MLQRWVAKLDEYGTQATSGTLKIQVNYTSVESSGPDPHHLDADPEPVFHLDADPDSDPVPRQGDANLRPLVLNFDFDADADLDTDPAFDFDADLCPAFYCESGSGFGSSFPK